jgi:hypothetical protein
MREIIVKNAKDKNFIDYEFFMCLTKHIKDMLNILHDELAHHEFGVAKSILWRDILEMFSEVTQTSINEKMPQDYFINLIKIFISLKHAFQYTKDASENNTGINKKAEKIGKLLEYYALDTLQLIHRYYKDRYDIQQQASENLPNPHSFLTVKCAFDGLKLRIEILNAYELITNVKCDSYVKVHIIPERSCLIHQNFKTKVQQNTHCPLYDEVFKIELTMEQKLMRDSIIYFNIKNKSLIGSNGSIAEAFLAFKDIPEGLNKAKTMQLTLTRLQCDGKSFFNLQNFLSDFNFCLLFRS